MYPYEDWGKGEGGREEGGGRRGKGEGGEVGSGGSTHMSRTSESPRAIGGMVRSSGSYGTFSIREWFPVKYASWSGGGKRNEKKGGGDEDV